jgi:glutamate N-acetyltransferase/amino-acid N-acetyltransferase
VARTVATSLLVKTALFGRDANWGRLLAAAGRAGVAFDPNVASVAIAGIEIVRGGLAVGAAVEAEAQSRMQAESFTVELKLGEGPGRFKYLTSDLGHAYVDVNAGDRA